MKHLYQNDEGEIIAADTLEQAARYHDCEMGGESEPRSGWSQIADDAKVRIGDPHDTGITEEKTAAEWAAECDVPAQVATSYI